MGPSPSSVGGSSKPVDLTLDDEEALAVSGPGLSRRETEPFDLTGDDFMEQYALRNQTAQLPRVRLPGQSSRLGRPRKAEIIDLTDDMEPAVEEVRQPRTTDNVVQDVVEPTPGPAVNGQTQRELSIQSKQSTSNNILSYRSSSSDDTMKDNIQPSPSAATRQDQRESSSQSRLSTPNKAEQQPGSSTINTKQDGNQQSPGQSRPLTPEKQVTPQKAKQSQQLSTSTKTVIDDSEISGMQDTEMSDEVPARQPTPEGPMQIRFDPLPAFTFVPPLEKVRVIKAFTDWSPPKDIPLENIKEVWLKNLEEFRDDHARYASDSLERARMHNEEARQGYIEAHEKLDAETASMQEEVPWYDAPAISRPVKARSSKLSNTFTFTFKRCQKDAQVTKMHVDMASFKPKAIAVPHFRTYYPIRRSQLVQSDRDLLFWPEATENDGVSEDEIKRKLKGQFHFRMVSRAAEVAYTQIGRQWQPYTEAFLQDLNMEEEDMLRFFLDDSYDDHVLSVLQSMKYDKRGENPLDLLKQTRRELRNSPQYKAITNRIQAIAAEEEGFDDLKKQKFTYLALAFCTVASSYQYMRGQRSFSFMYTLMQSPTLDIAKFLRSPEEERELTQQPKYSAATHFDFACRICHVYPCFVHGLDSMWDYRPPDGEDDNNENGREKLLEDQLCPLFDTLTSLHRQKLGRRYVRAPDVQKPERDVELQDPQLYGDPTALTRALVFFPCNHQGACEVGVCHCAGRDGAQRHYCEKSCGCDASCKRRFKGCSCARKGKTCSDESKCPCLRVERECDPDLCGPCGVYEVLDPQNRDKDTAFFKERCLNCQLQRNVPKRTLIGESTVHGIGLFAGEDIKKGEYIGEYLGAKLNWKQAERSGLEKMLNGYSYLFDMTSDQTVDAMLLGNKIRFVNSIPDRHNSTPKVLMCNTAFRMGLFATRDVAAGFEISFDYGDDFFHNHSVQTTKKTSEKGKGRAIGVKVGGGGGQKKKRAKVDKGKKPAVVMQKEITTFMQSTGVDPLMQSTHIDSLSTILDSLSRDVLASQTLARDTLSKARERKRRERESAIASEVDAMQIIQDDDDDDDKDEDFEEDEIAVSQESSDEVESESDDAGSSRMSGIIKTKNAKSRR